MLHAGMHKLQKLDFKVVVQQWAVNVHCCVNVHRCMYVPVADLTAHLADHGMYAQPQVFQCCELVSRICEYL